MIALIIIMDKMDKIWQSTPFMSLSCCNKTEVKTVVYDGTLQVQWHYYYGHDFTSTIASVTLWSRPNTETTQNKLLVKKGNLIILTRQRVSKYRKMG